MSTVCKFYQQGNCRYGTSCRFQHAGTPGNVFGKNQDITLYNRFTDPNRFTYSAKAEENKVTPQDAVVEALKTDFQAWMTSKIWPLSCYSMAGAAFLFEDLKDVSFEEARLEAYKAIASGTKEAFTVEFNAELQRVRHIIETVIKMDNKSLLELIQSKSGAPAVISAPFGNKSNIFGSTTNSNNVFGSTSTLGLNPSSTNSFRSTNSFITTTNPFAAKTSVTPSPNNIFATTTTTTTQSNNIFGNSQPIFGQTTSAFGLPSAAQAAPLFGQSAQTSSVFNQPGQSAPTQTFGLSGPTQTFGQVASTEVSVFGQATPNAPQNNPFAQPTQSQFGLTTQTNPLLFGPTPPPAFSGNTTSSTFGQHSATPAMPATPAFSHPVATTQADNTVIVQAPTFAIPTSTQLVAPPGFAAVSSKPEAANPFGISQPQVEAPPAPKSDMIPNLADDCLMEYKKDYFTIGQIPECPPPMELCV